jgi:hypothetical protein
MDESGRCKDPAGDHVWRVRHPHVARIAGEPAQAVHSLIGQRSTFQTIVSVVSDPAMFDPAVVITNFDYRFRVAEQLR